ncbi:hypothetical protein GCM10023328_02070 [Modestobacter marinus]|uniref:Uncharacterized protein n=1 Tax=Modestobacter marinus TaxID=477641 RepID=A0ABQ2FTZ8_9ACTN|nr:hypothetical protein GCM10011589_07890 [Modestobacter marinus]
MTRDKAKTSHHRDNDAPPVYLRRKEAAAFIGLAVGTLSNLASAGRGPSYHVPPGTRTPLYALHDLVAFVSAGRIECSGTAWRPRSPRPSGRHSAPTDGWPSTGPS